ncbi:MAG TPA: aspartate aminotransferase family protein [Candidatus Krumholzibacteria bacterium]|nr:aspartate aminotransferase family protein [Candidatus Krumholzibacteria bacterium]
MNTDRRRLAIDREQAHHFQTYGRQPLVLDRGEGTRVWDLDGREYLDALAGIAVNVLGHCHPAVTRALQEQAGRLIHVSNLYYTEVQSALVETLTRMAGFERAFLANSGAEAMEGALKLVRRHASEHGHGPKVVGVEGCFHGRTLATLALGADKYMKGFGPAPEGFTRIPRDDLGALDRALGDDTAAFVVEPIQGEGGIHEIDPGFLCEARSLCTERGVLMVFDEIQCGMGRTGHLFAWQAHEVRPDVLVTAKGLGGGVPIGAFLADTAVAEVLHPGDHGTTFGGNPLACAAAQATLDTIEAEDLAARAGRLGEHAHRRLDDFAHDHAQVLEVRGRGLMIGVELRDDADGQAVVGRMRAHGVLANCTAGSVIRLLPPLTIEESDLDRVLDVFFQSLTEVIDHA